MQVQLRQYVADLRRPPREQRQPRALEALLQPSYPRPTHRHRPGPCRQLPGLAVAVAVSAFAFVGAAVTGSAKELLHLVLKQSLQPLLN